MDQSADLQARIIEARTSGIALNLVGGSSKAFYGRNPTGTNLDVSRNKGIIDYQPGELTLTARGGTTMEEIAAALAEHDQMLPFEPPRFGNSATLAGTIACGLAGPRRPWAGSVRDYLLGVRLLTGTGKDMRIGSPVMKNVAGYDLFRPMAGAMGTLGLLLEIIIKVLPRPRSERTLTIQCSFDDAGVLLAGWQRASLPLSAACHIDDTLYIRLSGAVQAVDAGIDALGNTAQDSDNAFWHELNEQTLPFFNQDRPLYRLVLPATASYPVETDKALIDWGGRQHWLYSDRSFDDIQHMAKDQGGHASVFRNGDRNADVFQSLPAPVLQLQQRIRQALDPDRILNPGRLYKDL